MPTTKRYNTLYKQGWNDQRLHQHGNEIKGGHRGGVRQPPASHALPISDSSSYTILSSQSTILSANELHLDSPLTNSFRTFPTSHRAIAIFQNRFVSPLTLNRHIHLVIIIYCPP